MIATCQAFFSFSLYTLILDEFCGRLLQKWFHLSLLPCIFVLCKVTWQFKLSRGRIYSYLMILDWPWLMLADRYGKQCCASWKPEPHCHVSKSVLASWTVRVLWPSHCSQQPTANKAAGEWGLVRPASFSQPEIHLLMWSRSNAAHTFFFILSTTLWGWSFSLPHLTDEKTKAKRS